MRPAERVQLATHSPTNGARIGFSTALWQNRNVLRRREQSNKISCESNAISVAIRSHGDVKPQFLQFYGKPEPMYRCYFTQDGNIEEGYNLDVLTLDAAIATGRKILADDLGIDQCDGLEIWLDQALLYKFTG
jgi:hypothetical protein